MAGLKTRALLDHVQRRRSFIRTLSAPRAVLRLLCTHAAESRGAPTKNHELLELRNDGDENRPTLDDGSSGTATCNSCFRRLISGHAPATLLEIENNSTPCHDAARLRFFALAFSQVAETHKGCSFCFSVSFSLYLVPGQYYFPSVNHLISGFIQNDLGKVNKISMNTKRRQVDGERLADRKGSKNFGHASSICECDEQ